MLAVYVSVRVFLYVRKIEVEFAVHDVVPP